MKLRISPFRGVTAAGCVAVVVSLAACGPAGGSTDAGAVDASAGPARIAGSGPLQPLPVEPAADAARVELGRRLFSDPRLSVDNTVSCATCHAIASGGDDGRATAVGVGGAVGPLNTPTVLNSRYNLSQFWDGRASTLAEQVAGPIHNPIEMASNWDQVLAKLQADTEIVREFRESYPEGVTAANVADAIVTYEKSLVTPGSPFDRYLAGDATAMSGTAIAGYRLFLDFGCVACHQGRNIGGNMYQRFGIMGDYFADRGNVSEADYGRFNVTGREADRFHFKVPGLRNVAETAPYFHDGSATTLYEAVSVMARYQLGRPISDRDVVTIVEFLKALSAPVDEALL